MSQVFAAFSLALAMMAGHGTHRPLIQPGGDPSPGLLVNRTVGLRPFDRADPSRPTLIFIHGFNPTPGIVHFEMTQRLAESVARRGLGWNVLGWDWNASTLVSLRPEANFREALAQGDLLAAAIRAWGLDPARVHLIGHSSGALVATSAARSLRFFDRRPVAQLTLLEPATFYHSLIFEKLQAGALAPRVENFWSLGPSAFGKEARIAGVFDYQVDGKQRFRGVVCPVRSDHVFMVDWYIDTADDPNHPGGFNSSRLLGTP